MINRCPKSNVARLTHDHDATFATAPRDWRDAAQTSQGVVISLSQGLPGLGEQRGEDDPSHSRQGPEDRRVALLVRRPRRGLLRTGELRAKGIELPVRVLDLAVHHLQPDREGSDMRGGRLSGAWRDLDRLATWIGF